MTAEALEEAGTIAEALGVTEELAEAIARLAEDELDAGRPDPARVILEGLVVANPRCAGAWLLLARAHRALGQPLAARFCSEVAGSLDPGTPASRIGETTPISGAEQGPWGNWRRTRRGDPVTLSGFSAPAKGSSAEPRPGAVVAPVVPSMCWAWLVMTPGVAWSGMVAAWSGTVAWACMASCIA